ncbi:MAG: hypothetical protein RL490_637 [Pseudomonadota bacterium]|jgi:hypothetical protein
MERREFLATGGLLAAGMALTGAGAARAATDTSSLKGRAVDLMTPVGNREAWARLLGNTDMKSTKYGWAQGLIQGVRPGEAIRDICGFTMLSCARLLPHESGSGYRKILREIGLYTDLKTGEIIEEMVNPYLNETVKVVPITNDPFNHTITEFAPEPPSYGGINKFKPAPKPLQLDWTHRGDTLNLFSHINLFYPSSLPPAKWPRENANPFNQVTETFLYQIPWADMQNPKKTSVEYNGTWMRTTPWLPWLLMGPTPGHAQYATFMGAVDDINRIDRKTLDYVEKHFPKYLKAPDTWVDPSLSSLELYARTQTPAPVPAGQPVPRAPDPELPAWFKAMQAKPGA